MFKKLVQQNLFGLNAFMQKLILFDGNFRAEFLYTIIDDNQRCVFVQGKERQKMGQYSIGMGAEICNSFCTLYELGSFFQALFLAGIGTTLMRQHSLEWLRTHLRLDSPRAFDDLLLSLSEDDILEGMRNPLISIVICLDTDVDAVRYNKHQLWRLNPEAFHKRVTNISHADLNITPLDRSLENIYWSEKDLQIADKAIHENLSLPKTKCFQLYYVFEDICRYFKIDMKSLPVFFSLIPKEEIIDIGESYSFLNVLLDFQSFEMRKKYRELTNIDNPWIITAACKNCGQSSKTVLSSKLTAEDTIRVSCRDKEYLFKNEAGYSISLKGCGYVTTYPVCKTPGEMYKFIKNEDISIHFGARELIYLLKDSAFNPICFVQGDLGIIKDNHGNLIVDQSQPKGYGDSRDMLTSMLAIRNYILTTDTLLSRYLRELKVLGEHYNEIMFAYDAPTQLIDPDVPIYKESQKFVSDTSVYKQLQKGVSIETIFQKSINLYPFTFSVLTELKKNKIITKK
jgi:hypothetical protein